VSAGILYLLRSRVKLVWGSPHQWHFLINPQAPAESAQQPQGFSVLTASFYVANMGRVPATEIEIVFNWKPDNLNIWPVRPYDSHTDQNGRYTLKLSNLAPKEFLQIELLTPHNMPNLVTLRCKEGTGSRINIQPMRVFPRWFYLFGLTLVLIGVSAVVYVCVKLGSIFMGI
jgi:hypothetical protein